MNFKEFKQRYQKKEVIEFASKVGGNPLVSVMVQTYNHENYIEVCLNSILAQETNFEFEILLGEDFSTDATREICIRYAKRYPKKIRLFLHEPVNKISVLNILTGNFNALYNYYSAKGKYIAFCEGDDFWNDSLKLQKQVDDLDRNEKASLVYHSYCEIDFLGKPIEERLTLHQTLRDIPGEDLQVLNWHLLLSTICFRKISPQLPEEMAEVINVDSFLLSYLGNYGCALYQQNIEPSSYRRHPGGIWSKKQKNIKYDLKILLYKKLVEYYTVQKNTDAIQQLCEKLHQVQKMQAVYSLKTGNIPQGLKQVFRIFKDI